MEYITKEVEEIGVYYTGRVGDIKDEYVSDVTDQLDDGMDEDMWADQTVIGPRCIFEDSASIEWSYTDSEENEEFLEALFGDKYTYFLNWTTVGNWRGQSGYRFVKRGECLSYSHDVTIDYVARSRSKKYFQFRVAHHDVPCGATEYYIGLSERDYNKLEDADFNEIETFVTEHIENVDWISKF